jgi:chitin deacetylase
MTTMTDHQVLGELGWTAQIIYDVRRLSEASEGRRGSAKLTLSGAQMTGLVPAFWRPPYGDVDNRESKG